MKNILITGGTGSFGNVLIDYLLADPNSGVERITVFSRDENKQVEMKRRRIGQPIRYVIGDVKDEDSLLRALYYQGIDTIFHAAALKHVPIGEEFPLEVIKTTILGIKNVIQIAEATGVDTVVNLSTDKAVMPVNAYGMAKALSEKVVAAYRGAVKGVSLRYGNVMNSRGSVIPLFIQQMSQFRPVTVTNFNMTRFMLSLQEACFLSKVCAEEGNPGDLFVIKSPACSLDILVSALAGGLGGINYSVDEVGIRPGEKIHETLLTSEEVARGEEYRVGDITYIRVPAKIDLNIDYSEAIPFTSENTQRLDRVEVLDLLRRNNIV